jgi:antitoxin component YwqK of YwqJK toxin-antitoxin module
MLDGPYKEWSPEKQLKAEGQYRSGEFDGQWMYYDKKGQITEIRNYSNGKLITRTKEEISN